MKTNLQEIISILGDTIKIQNPMKDIKVVSECINLAEIIAKNTKFVLSCYKERNKRIKS